MLLKGLARPHTAGRLNLEPFANALRSCLALLDLMCSRHAPTTHTQLAFEHLLIRPPFLSETHLAVALVGGVVEESV